MSTSDATDELAFVSSLADPMCLHELAVAGWLDDAAFQRYLGALFHAWSAAPLRQRLAHPLALANLAALLDGGRGVNPQLVARIKAPAFPADQRRHLDGLTLS
jgi:hypothetical protein